MRFVERYFVDFEGVAFNVTSATDAGSSRFHKQIILSFCLPSHGNKKTARSRWSSGILGSQWVQVRNPSLPSDVVSAVWNQYQNPRKKVASESLTGQALLNNLRDARR